MRLGVELGLGRGTLATLAERNGRVIGVTCQSQFLAARSFIAASLARDFSFYSTFFVK